MTITREYSALKDIFDKPIVCNKNLRFATEWGHELIQVVGLRDYKEPRTGRSRKTTRFFANKWRFDKIQDVFDPIKRKSVIDKIPDHERVNIYFTVAQCFEEDLRKLQEQWAIPFDIDKIKFPEGPDPLIAAREVAGLAAQAIGIPYEDLGVVFSGNGVHLYVFTNYAIRSEEYFDENREHYNAIVGRINRALKETEYGGQADSSVWSTARILRLPDTYNKKDGRPTRMAQVMNVTDKTHGYYLAEQSGLGEIEEAETMSDAVLKQYPTPDTEAVLKGCLFLQHCKANPQQIDEPAWYAALSVTSRLENGREVSHALSEGHPGYNHDETEEKIDQALRASGPRTCKDIDTRWSGCVKCPHFGKITSPIMIQGENYLRSKDFGFRKMVIPKDGGAPRPGQPDYADLLKFFAQTFPYVSIENAGKLFIFNGKFWEWMSDDRIKSWMNQFVKPAPSVSEMNEFTGRLYVSHVHSADWFTDRAKFKMNFQNCVLDLKTMETSPHNQEHGFLNVLPFAYDPLATATRWEQFLKDSMADDLETCQLLEEFGGYALSGDPYPSWGEKYLVLYGDGENGKTIYLDVLSELAGRDAYSAVMAQDFENSNSRYNLFGKLFNKSEETSKGAFRDSQILKAMTGGGDITAERKYENQITFKNTAKIIMSVNDLPHNMDNTRGFLRRILIVPFAVTFEPGNPKRDPLLREKLLAELPGICNRLIAAYRGAKGHGRFVHSATVQKHIDSYRYDTDAVLQFIEERCAIVSEDDAQIAVVKDELFAAFVGYCRDSEIRPLGKIHFWRQAKKYIPNFDGRECRPRVDGPNRPRLLKGVKLLNNEL